MNRHLTAIDRLRHLLRLYRYALTAYSPTPPSDTAGATLLPGLWTQGSLPELHHWLTNPDVGMRVCRCPNPRHGTQTKHSPGCMRNTYWHLRERYIDPEQRTHHGSIRIVKHAQGTHRIQGLPPHSELADPFHVAIRPPVAILQWRPNVKPTEVQRGLDWLMLRMHTGDTSRISLPKDFRGAQPEPLETKVAA